MHLTLTLFQVITVIRALTLVNVNFQSILHKKNYFFYFTHLILQNTHINLSILHIYSIKYSLFYYFLLFSSLSLSLSGPTTIIITTLIGEQIIITTPIGEQTQPSFKIKKPFPTIIQYQKTNPRSETHSRSENQPIQAVEKPTETHSRSENQTIQAKTTH